MVLHWDGSSASSALDLAPDDLAIGPMSEVPVPARALASDSMSHLLVEGQQPVVPLPEREPAAIRAAVARIDPAALARFEADWTAATARARDEYSLLPARYFVEHWFTWVAVERWPQLAARLHACERIVAESLDRTERRQAAAEISHILRQAETATA